MAFKGRLIFKNTIVLYIRLFVVILMSFYASRLLMQTLGIEDFGVYSVVAGVSVMFASLKGAFASASQRFYSYELGLENGNLSLNRIFNACILIHIFTALVLLVILEAVGYYLVNHVLSIPPNRLFAANIILQTSIGATVFSTLIIPFDAMILAREKMNFYAFLSIVDAILKVLFIIIIKYIEGDKLILYGFVLLGVSLINLLFASIYCFIHFSECRVNLKCDIDDMAPIAKFGGWNFVGNLGFSLCHEANSFLLNIFGGVIANAARGLVYQLRNAIISFLSNSLVALRPQATQEYAVGNHSGFFQVVFYSTRMVYFIALCLAVPLFIYVEPIFNLWIGEVPKYAVVFMRISLVHLMVRSFHEPIDLVFKTVGELTQYQVISLVCHTLMLPVTYFILKAGAPIYVVFVNMSVAELIELVLIVRLAGKYGLNIRYYVKYVAVSLVKVTIPTIFITFVTSYFLDIYFIVELLIVLLEICLCVYFWGFDSNERKTLMALVTGKK